MITDGVIPSLHVDHKHSRIKQHHKEGRALRTETVVNDTYDFNVGRRLHSLDDLKKIGFAANRRLLRVQRISHDCAIGAQRFDDLHRPRIVDTRRCSSAIPGARPCSRRCSPSRCCPRAFRTGTCARTSRG